MSRVRSPSTAPIYGNCMNLPKIKAYRFKDQDGYAHLISKQEMEFNRFVILGELEQAPTHCIILSLLTNKIYSMVHTFDLEEWPENEF